MVAEPRPRSIPEMRGMEAIPRDRERKFTPKSYAAQYGILLEDAQVFVGECATHHEVERRIYELFSQEPALKRCTLLLDGDREPTDEEKRIADRLLRRLGLEPIWDEPEEAS